MGQAISHCLKEQLYFICYVTVDIKSKKIMFIISFLDVPRFRCTLETIQEGLINQTGSKFPNSLHYLVFVISALERNEKLFDSTNQLIVADYRKVILLYVIIQSRKGLLLVLSLCGTLFLRFFDFQIWFRSADLNMNFQAPLVARF